MNLHGPQGDRDRILGGKWDGRRDALGKDEQVLEGEMARLRNENKTLRDQLARALKELKAYQIKYPSPYVPSPGDEEEMNAWSAAPAIMSPLLDAYDCRILELEDTIKQQNFKLESFKERMESLVTENEDLRNKHLDGLKAGGGKGLSASDPLHSELLAELNERVNILMDENALIVEQKVVLSAELDKQQEMMEKQAFEIASLTKKFDELARECDLFKSRVYEAEGQRDEAAKHALSCSDSLGKAEQEIEALLEKLTVANQKYKDVDMAYQELKRQLKSMSVKFDEDGGNSLKRVKQAEDRVRELHNQLLNKSQELDIAQETLRKLRNEYQSTRQDAEGMLQVMAGLERQVKEYSTREEQVNRLAMESKERIEEALIIKEQAAVKEEQFRQEIDRLHAERKATLLHRQADIDKAVDAAKRSFQEQLTAFQQELEDLSAKNANLIFEAERATRESKSTREMFERLQRIYEEKHEAAEESIKTLTEELDAASVGRETERALKVDVQEQNKELRLIIDKYRSQMENHRLQLSNLDRSKENEVNQVKLTNRELQKELGESKRQLIRKTKDFEELKSSFDAQVASIERRYHDELAVYKLKLSEGEKLKNDLEASGASNDTRLQNLIDQLKEKFAGTIMTLEARMKVENERFKTLSSKNRSQELMNMELTEEKAHYGRLLEEARETMRAQDEELASCRSTITDLSQQLSSCHLAREESVYRAARAIEELNLKAMSPLRFDLPNPPSRYSQSLFGQGESKSPISPYANRSPSAADVMLRRSLEGMPNRPATSGEES